jgi:PAS domain S-box-containing protein
VLSSILVMALALHRQRALQVRNTLNRELALRSELEQALLKSRRNFRVLFDNNPHPMWAYDPETLKFIVVNDTAINKYGYTRNEFQSMSVTDVRPQEDIEAFMSALEKWRTDKEHAVEKRHRLKDGTLIDVEVKSRELELGERKAVLVVLTDITERKEIEHQLRQMQKLETIGQITSGIAHDFNNLLTVIQANSEDLLGDLAENSVSKQVELILEAAGRGARLVRQLMAAARQQDLHPEVINIPELLASFTTLVRRALQENIEISLRAPGYPLLAKVDAAFLETALLNLCVNSRDAMPRGGRITIEADEVALDRDGTSDYEGAQPGRYVSIAVSDTGSGMPPEVIKKAFEPFFTTKEVGKGTGLGLSMVNGFIRQSGGHIKIHSEVGSGTTIELYLPVTDAATSHGKTPDAAEAPAVDIGYVLLVEDDDLVRESVRNKLERLGYAVTVAPNAADAMSILEGNSNFDLVFSDVIMPGRLTGVDLAHQIRRRWPQIRVLLASGYSAVVLQEHDELPEGVKLISKPFVGHEFMVEVRAAMRKNAPQPSRSLGDSRVPKGDAMR